MCHVADEIKLTDHAGSLFHRVKGLIHSFQRKVPVDEQAKKLLYH